MLTQRSDRVSDTPSPGDGRPTYSVVIPCYNSSRTIGKLIGLLSDVFAGMGASYEIVAVDDASPDSQTWPAIVKSADGAPVKAFQFTRNFGRTAAVLCGMAHARGRWIIVMDDDLQHQPEDIPKLAAMRDHDAVAADFPFSERHHTLSQRLTSRLKNWFDFKVLGTPRNIRFSPFIMFRSEIVSMMLRSHYRHPYLPALFLHVSRDIVSVHASHAPRMDGRSNLGFVKRLNMFSHLLFNNSPLLLRAVAVAGAGFAILAIVIGGYLIADRLISARYAPGWTSLVVIELFMGGAILLSLGIIGEYLIRIIQLGEQRPTYYVRTSYEASADETLSDASVKTSAPVRRA
ncbi:MAG: glycosyltransferase family 2 protein [Rhizobiales bacterium]|nr:glycosyltransferase family 2 protein [Hyphomicrobiales bacterium]